MAANVVPLVVSGLMICLLCGPPLLAMHVLRRRAAWSRPEHRAAYRGAMGFAAGALAFNLIVSTFLPPDGTDAAVSDVFGRVHLFALGLSWLCFWGALALSVLVRRRRRYAR